MNTKRLLVHLGLDRNNKVQCHLVQMCGRLIPFVGSFELRERYLKTSYWCIGRINWAVHKNLKEWKESVKVGYKVVRFQRVTYTRDID